MAYELTSKEIEKIEKLNAKNGYGISFSAFKKLVEKHKLAAKRGDEKTLAKIEFRLVDINYHNETGLIRLGKYKKALDLNRLNP